MNNPDIAQLRRLFSYNKDTGSLDWLARTEFDCPNEKERRRWNTRYAGRPAFRVKSNGYREGMIFRTVHKAHRVIWALQTGRWPTGDIDHINGDKSDNRFENLRDVSRVVNARNQKVRATNTSGVMGVSKHKNVWRAVIHADGKQRHIGLYATLEDAAQARRAAEINLGFHENHGRRT